MYRKGVALTKKTAVAALFLLLAGVGIYLGTVISPETLEQFLLRWNRWAPAAYIGLFAVLPAFFFPVAVLALAGGLLFGLWWGSLYTFIGAILNCTVMFFLARYAGRAQVEMLIQRKLSSQWRQRIQNLNSSGGFVLLIVLRLIPAVPYNLINYAFGLTAMPWRTYILGSAIGIIPGTLAFINIGDKAMDVTSPEFRTAIGLLILLLAVTGFLGKKCFPQNTETEK